MTQDVLRGHEFDGITEFDNRLPNWWLWTFYLACIFSFVYWIHYHVLRTGPSSLQQYQAEMAEAEAAALKQAVTDEELVAKSKDAAAVAAGQAVFTTNCVACHAANGGATMVIPGQPPVQLPGVNLTDKFWKHGGKPTDIYRTVTQGVAGTAMVAWGMVLGANKCQDAVAYVLTLRNTNVPGGKEPEGQEYVDK